MSAQGRIYTTHLAALLLSLSLVACGGGGGGGENPPPPSDSGNHPPVASAGKDQSVTAGSVVHLDGSGSSDQDSDPLTYSWSQTKGTGVALNDKTSAKPSFEAPGVTEIGTFEFRLTTSDGKASDSDLVVITVAPDSTPAVDDNPDAFTLAEITGVEPGSVDHTATMTVTGIDAGVTLAAGLGGPDVANATLIVNGIDQAGDTATVTLGDNVWVRMNAAPAFGTTRSVTLTVGGKSDAFEVSTRAADILPEMGTFTDIPDAEPNTVHDSNAVAVTAFDGPLPVVVANGQAAISTDGGASWSAFTDTGLAANPGDQLMLQGRASGDLGGETQVDVTIGDVTRTFHILTRAADTTPDAFPFTAMTDIDPALATESDAVQVRSIEVAVTATIDNGELAVSADGVNFDAFATTVSVRPDDWIKARVTSAADFEVTTTANITIGGRSEAFSVTTRAAITTPDHFAFAPKTGVDPEVTVTSDPVQIRGIEATVQASAANGDVAVSRDGTTFTPFAVTVDVNDGDWIKARVTSGTFGATETVDVTIGGMTHGFSATTRTGNTTPTNVSFDFPAETGVEPEQVMTSPLLQVEGLESPAAIALANADDFYQILESDGITVHTAWTNAPGTVPVDGYFQLRGRASDLYTAERVISATVGGRTANYSVTTRDPDFSPDPFSLGANQSAVEGNSVIFGPIELANVDLGAPVRATATYNSGTSATLVEVKMHPDVDTPFAPWIDGSTAGLELDNRTVWLRATAAPGDGTEALVNLRIGSGATTVSSSAMLTSIARDARVSGFNPGTFTGAAWSHWYESNTIFVGGINVPVPITVRENTLDQTQVSINGGPWVENDDDSITGGMIENGNTIKLRMMTKNGDTGSFPSRAILELGAGADLVSGTFEVGTEATDTSPVAFTFATVTGLEPLTYGYSNTVVLSGIGDAAGGQVSVSGTGISFSLNGGTWRTTATAAHDDDALQVRMAAPSTLSSTGTGWVTVGAYTTEFNVETRDEVTLATLTPFTNIVDAAKSSTDHTGTTTVGAIDNAQPITISGDASAQFSKDGATWHDASATGITVASGQSVTVRMNAASAFSTTRSATISVGTAPDVAVATFSVTSEAQDIEPDGFSFAPREGVGSGELITSAEYVVVGINDGASVSISGDPSAEFDVFTDNGLGSKDWRGWAGSGSVMVTACTGTAPCVSDKVRVRVRSGVGYSTTTTATLTIGSASADFNVTTVADTTPPTGEIHFPRYTSETDADTVRVSGIARDNDEVQSVAVRLTDPSLAVTDIPATFDPATDEWFADVPLTLGANGQRGDSNVKVLVTDKAGLTFEGPGFGVGVGRVDSHWKHPVAMANDPTTGTVYMADDALSQIMTLDPVTGVRLPFLAMPEPPRFLAIDPATRRLFVATEEVDPVAGPHGFIVNLADQSVIALHDRGTGPAISGSIDPAATLRDIDFDADNDRLVWLLADGTVWTTDLVSGPDMLPVATRALFTDATGAYGGNTAFSTSSARSLILRSDGIYVYESSSIFTGRVLRADSATGIRCSIIGPSAPVSDWACPGVTDDELDNVLGDGLDDMIHGVFTRFVKGDPNGSLRMYVPNGAFDWYVVERDETDGYVFATVDSQGDIGATAPDSLDIVTELGDNAYLFLAGSADTSTATLLTHTAGDTTVETLRAPEVFRGTKTIARPGAAMAYSVDGMHAYAPGTGNGEILRMSFAGRSRTLLSSDAGGTNGMPLGEVKFVHPASPTELLLYSEDAGSVYAYAISGSPHAIDLLFDSSSDTCGAATAEQVIDARGFAVDFDGTAAFIADTSGNSRLLRVDITDRTNVACTALVDDPRLAGAWLVPQLDALGRLLLFSAAEQSLFAVDPFRGDISVISNWGGRPLGLGPTDVPSFEGRMVYNPIEHALLGFGVNEAWQIDLMTGDRFVISDNTIDPELGLGPDMRNNHAIAFDPALGTIVGFDDALEMFFQLELLTGDRVIIDRY